MQITVNVPEEIVSQAEARGLSPEGYVEQLVADRTVLARLARKRELTREEFAASLDTLAQFSHKIPILPDEALTRESFYEDHD